MIPNFSGIIQQDCLQIVDHVKGKLPPVQDHPNKTKLAALRILSTVGMITASVLAISAVVNFTSNPLGAAAKAMLAVILYVIGHEVFVMCTNSEKGPLGQLQALGQLFQNNFKQFAAGKKTDQIDNVALLTQGTFLPILCGRAVKSYYGIADKS